MAEIKDKVVTVEALSVLHEDSKKTYMPMFNPAGSGTMTMDRDANMSGSVPNATSTSTIFVAVAKLPISNFKACIENGVRACEQGLNTINFIADTKPDVDIVINYAVFA